MVFNEINEILQNLHVPALISSRSRTILAANDAVRRLCGKPPEESLLGKDIHNLGFTLIPADQPEQFTAEGWNSLLEACVSGSSESVMSQDEDEIGNYNVQPSRAEDFWDNEEQRFPFVADVLVSHGDIVPASQEEYPKSWLRARMSIRSLHFDGELIYLIEFHRPTDSRFSSELRSGISAAPIEDSSANAEDEVSFPAKNDTEREIQVHEKVSANIPYFSALFDSSGQALHFSKSWGRVTGMSHEATVGNGWFQAIHHDDRPAMMDAWAKVIKGQENSWTWDARYRRTDGTYYWALLRLESSEKQSGTISYWYGSMIDVDTLLRTRQESENRRKAVLELIAHTDVCLWSITEDRKLSLQEGSLQWNPMATVSPDTLGTSGDSDDVNMNVSKSAETITDVVEQIIAEKLSSKTLEHNDKGRWYRSTLIADRTGQLPHQKSSQVTHAVLGLTIDITDLKARGELEAQTETLIARERAATEASELKSQFVANISHELRTPLAGIIGMNDLLMESLSSTENEDFRHLSEGIRSSAAQLLTVINDVLDLSKIEAGRLELEAVPFHICQLVNSVSGMMAVQAQRKGLSLDRFVDVMSSLVIVGDMNRLHQILLNLLGNSIKFTQSGTVTLSVSVLSSTETDGQENEHGSHSESSAASPNDGQLTRIQFVVEDTGCGMSDSTTAKIFEAFSQADSSTARQYGGTGLGLTISRQLVEMMGGTIVFTSKLNIGTKAVVIIPFRIAGPEIGKLDSSITGLFDNLLAKVESVDQTESTSGRSIANIANQASTESGDDKSGRPANSSPTLSKADRNKTLVLIVEDNAVNMQIAMLMTKKLGLQTITASNGEEALELLGSRAESQQSLPNVILMDCMMPVMDGYKATKTLRQDKSRFSTSTRSVPIIALTASAHKGDEERCLEAGMDDYLIKPVNKKSLETALIRWTLVGRERLTKIQEDDTAGEIE